MRTSLIILTRNEINGVKTLLHRLPLTSVDEYFAIDYNSTDGTIEFFEANGIPVIKQHQPGRAEAFRLAAQKAHGQILIFFSPDGNENPVDIPLLIKKIAQGADLAIASRFLKGSRNEEDDQIFKWRKWANQAFTWGVNVCFRTKGPYVTDSVNGYRAISKRIFIDLKLDAKGFAIEYQMTIRTLKRGLIIKEIPTVEGNRIGGLSGSAAIPTGFQFIGVFLRELFT